MNLPWVYLCSPSWSPLPPPSPSHPSGSSQCTSPEHLVSCIEPGLAIHFLYDNIDVSMLFSQIIPPSPSPSESKRLFYTSVFLLLSGIQFYCYHLSKFHIYALSSVQFSSVAQSCPTVTPWIPARQTSLSITNSQSSLRLTSIQSVMPSSHLILSSPSPPAPNPSQHQSLFQWVNSAWGGQSTGVSALASFLPKKSQSWSSEWTG